MKIIFFDGVCNLCNRTIKFIIDHDSEKLFKFAPIQSEIYRSTFPLEQYEKIPQSIVFLDEGKKLERSIAILTISSYLFPKFNFFFRLFIFIPESLRDALYNRIAKNRYGIFGKSESCRIPDDSINDRFLQ